MYVIAIGWLYVTLLMAATEANLTAGVLTFYLPAKRNPRYAKRLYGAAPLALFLWVMGTPQRRRNRLFREAGDDAVGKDNGSDARHDQ
jgi:hypothetical protein